MVAKISRFVANCGHGSEENQFRTNHNRTRQSRRSETPGRQEEKGPLTIKKTVQNKWNWNLN
jgi:hypothetical protein